MKTLCQANLDIPHLDKYIFTIFNSLIFKTHYNMMGNVQKNLHQKKLTIPIFTFILISEA